MEFLSSTKLYALIGDPIEHSLSPTMQNIAFQRLGLNSVYLAFRVKSEYLEFAVKGMKSLGVLGFNVTVPHKAAVMGCLDKIDASALKIRAVNTVVNKDGELVGYNTDGEGALATLKEEGLELEGKKVVLLGAGGAAKAIAFSIAPVAGKLTILNRTESKAVELASSITGYGHSSVEGVELTVVSLRNELADANVLINATSVGMYPKSNESPVEQSFLHAGLTVFDIVYNPFTTRLLKDSKAVGAHTISGVKMLVYQGALAFELWTGKKPPISEMCEAVEKVLRGREA